MSAEFMAALATKLNYCNTTLIIIRIIISKCDTKTRLHLSYLCDIDAHLFTFNVIIIAFNH